MNKEEYEEQTSAMLDIVFDIHNKNNKERVAKGEEPRSVNHLLDGCMFFTTEQLSKFASWKNESRKTEFKIIQPYNPGTVELES
jgi:hypothetical protein